MDRTAGGDMEDLARSKAAALKGTLDTSSSSVGQVK